MNSKILIFVPFMSGFGGTETVINNLFEEYQNSYPTSNKLVLVSIGGYDSEEWLTSINNKKIVQFSKSKLVRTFEYLMTLPFFLFNEVRHSDVNVVISTNPIMWMVLYWIKKIFHYKYKVVSWYHYSLEDKPVKHFFMKSADSYLAISTGIAKQITRYGIDDKKIKTVFNPVVKSNISVPRSSGDKPIQFIYVGRIMLDGQKNLRALINALSRVKLKWQLDIYGQGETEKVQEFINSKKLQKQINLKGFKANVWESLGTVDFLVLTSKYEGFPMVLNEAISVGIPVISYNCETGPEDIINDKNGFLVNPCNEDELIKTIEKASKKISIFTDTSVIKKSISKFYSQNYIAVFLNAIFK